jgi:hypothetical protein
MQLSAASLIFARRLVHSALFFYSSLLLLIRLFQPKPDILRAVEPSTTTAGGDLKQPDKQELARFPFPQLWRYGATVSTRPFQGRNTGSIPVSATNKNPLGT